MDPPERRVSTPGAAADPDPVTSLAISGRRLSSPLSSSRGAPIETSASNEPASSIALDAATWRSSVFSVPLPLDPDEAAPCKHDHPHFFMSRRLVAGTRYDHAIAPLPCTGYGMPSRAAELAHRSPPIAPRRELAH